MCDLYVLAAHLLVAHCVAGDSRSIDMRSSRAPCTCRVMLGISISVPCLSQSHRTSPPKLAWQHAVGRRRRRVQILRVCCSQQMIC